MAWCEAQAIFDFTENRRTAHFAFIEPHIDGGAEPIDRQVVAGDICNHAYGPEVTHGNNRHVLGPL